MGKNCLDCGILLAERKRKRCHSCVARLALKSKKGYGPFEFDNDFKQRVYDMRKWAFLNNNLVEPAKKNKRKTIADYQVKRYSAE